MSGMWASGNDAWRSCMTPRVLSDIGIEEGAFVIHSYPRHTWSRDSLIQWSTSEYWCVCMCVCIPG